MLLVKQLRSIKSIKPFTMKKQILVLVLLTLCVSGIYAQAPQAFKYQGVARDAAGAVLNAQAITVRLSIHDVTTAGTTLYQESHVVTTNSFGLFSVNMGQGTVLSGNFSTINWGLNNKYIEQEVDFGSGFVNMGTSQFLSVPYALYSGSSPASSYTSGTGIAITGTVISNTAPDQLVTISPGLNTSVSGTYPGFTVDATPSLSIIGNQLSISNGNTVILPATSSSLTDGPGISIISGSVINTSPDQTVTISPGMNTSVSGTYPNFTINASSGTTYTNGAGISITSGSIITNSVPDVPVTFTNSGPATITGAYPNFTINSSSGVTYTNGSGIGITSGSIITNAAPDVPVTFTNSGPSTITGAYPNFTINSANSPTYTNGVGISITSGSIINTLPGVTPTVAITTTVDAAASVSSSGSSFNINVPPPAFANSGPATITGSYPNYTINSPTVTTYTNGTGISIASGSVITNTAPDVPVTFSNSGPSTISGAYPNFTLTSSSPTIAVTTTASAGASVSSSANTFNINVPAPTFTNAGPTTITGAYPNFTVNSSSNSGWATTGNAGTAPATNYLGTSDLQPLVIRTNAIERMRIAENGNASIGSTTTNSARLNLFATTTDTSTPVGLSVTNNYNGASNKFGIDVNVDGAGSATKYGISSTLVGLAGDGSANYAFNAAMTPNGSGTVYGNNTIINAAGSGVRYGHYTSISSPAANSSNIYGHRILMSGTNATALKYGLYVSGEDMSYFSKSVGIGTATPIYKLVVAGPQANAIDGPNMSFVTTQDNYPTMHLLNWNHAEQYMMFNAYYDGAFRSSSTTGNFKMGSYNGKMIFQASGGYAAGTNMNSNFTDAMMIGNNGYVGIGINSSTTQPTYRFHVERDDAGVMSYFNNPTQSSGTALRTEVVSTATSSGNRYGIYSQAANGQSVNYGHYSRAYGGQQSFGIWTESGGQSTVWNMGIYSAATGTNGVFAAYMVGNVWVGGTLSKSAGTFKIDHPQDPENKFLIHSFVESPDMMNVYNGNIITDANGDAIVQLPTYFEAENISFKYQLTVIGQFAQAIVFEEVQNNQFKIKTDKPNVKVSWQVTGVRNDAYAQKNRVVPEVDKQGVEKGKYLAPEAFGLGEEMRIGPKREDVLNNEKK